LEKLTNDDPHVNFDLTCAQITSAQMYVRRLSKQKAETKKHKTLVTKFSKRSRFKLLKVFSLIRTFYNSIDLTWKNRDVATIILPLSSVAFDCNAIR
jgi:hypothetical protein